MEDYLLLGGTPPDEVCAQVGEENYGEKARLECRIFAEQLRRYATAQGKVIPAGVTIRTKSNHGHDYGTYYEVAIFFDTEDEAQTEFAYWLENNLPGEWDAEARAALGLAPASA